MKLQEYRGLLWLSLSLFLGQVSAHEGHEHKEEAPATEQVQSKEESAARLALHSARVELVAAREGDDLLIYIDDFETNAPLEGLKLQLRAADRVLQARSIAPGLYQIPLDVIPPAGGQVEFTLQGEGWQEQLSGVLPAALEAQAPTAQRLHWSVIAAALASAAVLIGLLLWFLRRRRA